MKAIIILLALFLSLSAHNFSKVSTGEPHLVQKGAEKEWCPVCGMSIKMFYKTSHAAELKNKTPRQYCSMRCLVEDKEEYGIEDSSIKVVDASSQKLIYANDAFYVLDSDVKGTMSRVSKLAFALKDDANEHIKKHGGKIVSFDEAIKSAKQSLASDKALSQSKKEKKVYAMGEKIYEKMCSKDIDETNYIEINELKADIKNSKLCKPMDEQKLQAVALYLWEVKRLGDLGSIEGKIEVTKDEKCPICGMFVYKYPKWAAQIYYPQTHYSFDGVKDLMKYYFLNKEGISKILVTDYYSQKAIEARDSFFVAGSDVYGPMGDELIPFAKLEDAKTFSLDHKGKKILKFDEIDELVIRKLDE
ncbi:MAG: nitrous oxide reductase accessory protein NosL [Sulfurimonas sp.]|uniref:nitrous oxide reductase accessory protein NosL n=1 Tax=Sulfurimonas sp. TaxID=2022749 RepID=UPI0025CDDBB1|nr:nitrous oxide reductase accessory protein NosL [Sulfurimonas sp.]MCK9490911.1 nitrous oxide reductase accessory protein NosL [Sulfurimonas sp.]